MPNQRSNDKTQLAFWIDKKTKKQAEILAKNQGKTVTEILTSILEEQIENYNIDLSDQNADQRWEMLADQNAD